MSETYTPTQERVIRIVRGAPNNIVYLGGHGRAPLVSAARALVRKGVLIAWRTSAFAPNYSKTEIWDVPSKEVNP